MLILWDMGFRLGKKWCMVIKDVMDIEKEVGLEDRRFVRLESSWSVGSTVRE